MSNIENKEKTKELLDGFFNKGWCCDLDEIYDICLGLIKENEELRYRIAKDYKRNGEYVKAKSIIINHKTEFVSKDKIREILNSDKMDYELIPMLQELLGDK